MRIVKRLLIALGAIVGILAAVVIVRTALLVSPREQVPPISPIGIDANAAAEHLSRAIQFKTISHQDPKENDPQAFTGLHDFFKEAFPNLHKTLTLEQVDGNSLLYTWKGNDPNLAPILLMAHQDVVPVAPGTGNRWSEPPFSGRIEGGFIWGRGAMDDKGSLAGLMEAIEALIKTGYSPRRTVYLASGHDEEVSGTGAEHIAALLASRGVKIEYVLDEGGSIFQGGLSGVSAPVALVGVAEKGYATVELSVSGQGGHSSMPPARTAIGELSCALAALQRYKMRPRFAGIAEQTLASLAPAASIPMRAIYANTWLFGPLIVSQLGNTPSGNAMVRTTTAETVVGGGVKENVLPAEAHALVNFRIAPGDTVQAVVAHVRKTIRDPHVKVTVMPDAHDPSIVSGKDTAGFRDIRRTILQVFPEVRVVSPYLVLGATDSRRYEVVSRDIYRFIPTLMTPSDLERLHGTNERVSVDGYARMVAFYAQLIRNSTE